MAFAAGMDKKGFSNFAGQSNLGYSFANPYPSPQATADGFAWNDRLNSTFAVAGDLNPGGPAVLVVTPDADDATMRAANSPNHDRQGQSLLFGDGSVRFCQTPFEGPRKDNVYTAGGVVLTPGVAGPTSVAVLSPPLTAGDSVLLPTAYDSARTDAAYAARYRKSAWRFVWWLDAPRLRGRGGAGGPDDALGQPRPPTQTGPRRAAGGAAADLSGNVSATGSCDLTGRSRCRRRTATC